MSKPTKSNYARKHAFLTSYNRRPAANEGVARRDAKGGRVWGFDFADNEKPWKKGSK